jgi:cytoskeletal protein CcmA (bactofilin family)
MSWIRPKRTESPAPARPAASSPAPAAASGGAVGIPADDEEIPIDLASGTSPTTSSLARGATQQTATSAGTTTLTDDTTIVGSITTASDLWIAGRVDGNIQSGAAVNVAVDGAVKGDIIAQRIRVEEGGTVEGTVKTSDALVAGKVRGPIVSSGRLTIAPSGEVIGDVTAGNLRVEDGATLQGRCTMARSGH